MSKECPGKYHGSAVKYIADDEKYCVICQQEIALKKQKRKETFIKGLKWAGKAAAMALVSAVAGKAFGGKMSSLGGGENVANAINAGTGGTPTA